jgi:ADP-heptose:LPS heptosyltransferase
MKILVRAPNWLGDLVMSLGFFGKLAEVRPEAEIHVIARDSLAGLAALFPRVSSVHRFSRSRLKGIAGPITSGRDVARHGPFDLFFCLPDSFSSALMGFVTGSRVRIGYRAECRSLLLTKALPKPGGLHRVEEYAALLGDPPGRGLGPLSVHLDVGPGDPEPITGAPPDRCPVVINVNSEASSRRMSLEKWVAVARALVDRLDCHLVLIGGPGEIRTGSRLREMLGLPGRVTDLTGRTGLKELASVLKSARLVISTDSGPAHLANAVGTPTIVLFGAGDEAGTGPYDRARLAILRAAGFECAPCVSNVCKYGDQRCLEGIADRAIIDAADALTRR